MTTKKDLIGKFQKTPNKYWKVKLFDEKGFVRKKCSSCGKFFWTLNPEAKLCGDSPCVKYSFINNSPCKKKLDYIQTWRAIEKFFKSNGHESIPSYPSVCRWFPKLYFTVASIVAFQRKLGNETVFEMPANPLIIPQSCMRFNDLPNVGRTGKHYTNFVMIGQHSIYDGKSGYWKDRCTQLDFELMTKVFNIKPEEITWIEDAWVGPAAFGYSLEYFTRGLELGNAVFTEFVGTPESYKVMEKKIIDMGSGLERFAWITQGTPTSYDATFGPLIQRLKRKVDYNKEIFMKYAEMAGGMNIDEAKDIEKAKKGIAKALGVDFQKLEKQISQLEAVYAIADHTKSLLFAISDGLMPSNISGGYNLRLILRRALELMKDFNLNIELTKVAEEHAKYLKPMFPNLRGGLQNFSDIIEIERKRFEETRSKGRRIIEDILQKGEDVDDERLMLLYESNGIPPELVQDIAKDKKTNIKIPDDFYARISERHMQEKEEGKLPDLNLKGLPETKALFYKSQKQTEFTAKVLKLDKDWVVLDKTLFYPEAGGQAHDVGTIGDSNVLEVQKFGNVIAHRLEGTVKKGQTVKGRIDWDRRWQLMQHHTAIHVINGAARQVLGNHIWQAGSGKTAKKAHLDITHYQGLSQEQVRKIEDLANEVVQNGLRVESMVLPRAEAEKRFGMRIYQGGAIPDRNIRIINTKDFDVEACGGTHLSNTKDIGRIIILSTERIQDGVVRITIKAGKAAESYGKESINTMMSMLELIRRDLHFVEVSDELLQAVKDPDRAIKELQEAAAVFSVSPDQLSGTLEKFCGEIVENAGRLDILRRQLKLEPRGLKDYLKSHEFKSLRDVSEYVFSTWKEQGKELEKFRRDAGKARADKLLEKAKEGEIFDVLEGDRKELIAIAEEVLNRNPKVTIILANQSGDIVGMSRARDMGQVIKKLCEEAGGSGGGGQNLGQGKAELSKFIKIMGVEPLKT